METNILLENGTNELEILEFKLGDDSYGINVAKITEIIPFQPVTPVPNAHPSIEGIFMPRDKMITAINLKNCIQRGVQDASGLFIITNFNKLDIAFHVDSVVGIHRVSWTAIIKPDATVNTVESGISTGIVKFNDRLVIILDFEKIVTDISPETGLKVADIEDLGSRERKDIPIVLAEDSALLHKLISDSLRKSGYVNLIDCVNGKEAWDFISACEAEGTLAQKVGLIITDIEMPVMDGHRLTKLVKSNDKTKHIPLVIFSSLVNDEMRRKGEQLGADAQLSKPEIGNLVKEIDRLVNITVSGDDD
ncbi:two-component system, chemotaxis family, response regulator CheV [Lachnospiraceae bacterium]|nr:two-component system, chemotaxis family, response regulator CheV [Lachnospiraceae bacterium]